MNELISNLEKLHTTEQGEERIRRNLSIETDNPVNRCRELILRPDALIERRGKNWYIRVCGLEITVNAYSYTIITAHNIAKNK